MSKTPAAARPRHVAIALALLCLAGPPGRARAAPQAAGPGPHRAAPSAALAAPAADVTVHGPRIRLGELLPELPAPWAEVDLGPSPPPLQVRRVTAGTIDQRIRQARLAPAPTPLPSSLRVGRAGSQLSQPQLRALVEAAVLEALPDQAELRTLSVAGGAVVGEGALSVEVAPPRWRSGTLTIMATVRSADGLRAQVPALVEVELASVADAQRVTRGQDITIRVVVGSVLVQSPGTAQAAGAVGEIISVLPAASKRLLHGRVVDGGTVEVQG